MPLPVTTAGTPPKRTATVRGVPISQPQIDVAIAFLQAAKKLKSPQNSTLALIVAGLYESSLGQGIEPLSHDPTRQAPLSCPVNSFTGTGLTQVTQQAEAFLNGGPHFTSAIAAANRFPSTDDGIVQLAAYAEGILAGGGYTSGPNAQPSYKPSVAVAEARVIAQIYGGMSLAAGGVTNDGISTGTSPNDYIPSFTVANPQNPNQDFWTTINQLAQERQWYLFSDGETVYLADGPDLLQQDPVMTLDRWGDSDKILELSFSWDNTSFQYAVNRRKGVHRVVRKSVLQKVQSPTSCTLRVICDIDQIRGGDVIKLTNCGPGNGKWVVGDCTRSAFDIYTECTLIPPMAPLSELEAAGSGNQIQNPTQSTSGSVFAAMVQEATSISDANLPYVWGGGHTILGKPSIGQPGDGNTMTVQGFDCSGAVSAVLGAGGLLSSPEGTSGLIAALGQYAVKGRGQGKNYVTIWINPNTDALGPGHVFLEFNPGPSGSPQFWGTWIGGADSGPGSGRLDSGSGATWWKAGTPSSLTKTYQAYRIPLAILAAPLTKSITGARGLSPLYSLYRTTSLTVAEDPKLFPAAPYSLAGTYGAVYNALYQSFPGMSPDTYNGFSTIISVTTDKTQFNAQCLDVYSAQHSGGATPADVAYWLKKAAAASGDGIRAQPIIYAHIDDMPTVKANVASFGAQAYRLWVRDITGSEHIPTGGYSACEYDTGTNYNTSQVAPSFFVKPAYGGVA